MSEWIPLRPTLLRKSASVADCCCKPHLEHDAAACRSRVQHSGGHACVPARLSAFHQQAGGSGRSSQGATGSAPTQRARRRGWRAWSWWRPRSSRAAAPRHRARQRRRGARTGQPQGAAGGAAAAVAARSARGGGVGDRGGGRSRARGPVAPDARAHPGTALRRALARVLGARPRQRLVRLAQPWALALGLAPVGLAQPPQQSRVHRLEAASDAPRVAAQPTLLRPVCGARGAQQRQAAVSVPSVRRCDGRGQANPATFGFRVLPAAHAQQV